MKCGEAKIACCVERFQSESYEESSKDYEEFRRVRCIPIEALEGARLPRDPFRAQPQRIEAQRTVQVSAGGSLVVNQPTTSF
jgi:hypothetical protein